MLAEPHRAKSSFSADPGPAPEKRHRMRGPAAGPPQGAAHRSADAGKNPGHGVIWLPRWRGPLRLEHIRRDLFEGGKGRSGRKAAMFDPNQVTIRRVFFSPNIRESNWPHQPSPEDRDDALRNRVVEGDRVSRRGLRPETRAPLGREHFG